MTRSTFLLRESAMPSGMACCVLWRGLSVACGEDERCHDGKVVAWAACEIRAASVSSEFRARAMWIECPGCPPPENPQILPPRPDQLEAATCERQLSLC